MSEAAGFGSEVSHGSRAVAPPAAALAAWAVGLAALTAAPYFYLASRTADYAGTGARFNWILPPYPEDSLSYAAWVAQAASGAWLFQVKYTGIEHAPALFHPLFLSVGWLSAATGLDAGQALCAARLLGVLVFAAALFGFLCRLPVDRRTYWIALWLIALSSGAGFLAARLGFGSADLWMPELNTLWSLTWNPVSTFALATMLWIATLIQRFDTERRLSLLAWAGFGTGLLAFLHPYDVPVMAAIAALVIATGPVGAERLRPLGLYLLVCAPAVLLQLAIANLNPILSRHSATLMSSPSPGAYVSALGIPALFFAVGLVLLVRDGGWRSFRLPLFWVAATALLVYAPVWFQRHMALGVHVPVCIVAAVGLERVAARASAGRSALFAALVVVVVAASALTQLHNISAGERAVRRDTGDYYLPEQLAQVFEALRSRSDPQDRVLAHPSIAVQIPGRTGNTVLLGHWAQSVDARDTRRWLGFLFAPLPDEPAARAVAERRASLAERRVRYLLVDPRMRREWFRGPAPEWLAHDFAPVFQAGPYTLLEVR